MWIRIEKKINEYEGRSSARIYLVFLDETEAKNYDLSSLGWTLVGYGRSNVAWESPLIVETDYTNG